MSSLFDLVFDSVGAFQQIGCFLGSSLCILIGGFLVGEDVYTRRRADKVTGTVTGVRQENGFYHAVYSYRGPDGQSYSSTSNTGFSSPVGMDTGKPIELRVFKSHPGDAQPANGAPFEIIGWGFGLTGLLFFYVALTSWPITKMTFVILLVMGLAGFIKARKTYLKVTGGLSLKDMRDKIVHAPMVSDPRVSSLPETTIEQKFDAPTLKRMTVQQGKAASGIGLIFALCGLPLLALAAFLSLNIMNLETHGFRTDGIVVSLESSWTSGQHPSIVYHAVVAFTPSGGTPIQFKDSVGQNPPAFRDGQSVKVLYLGEKPAHAIVDRGWANWLAPGIAATIGFLMLFFAPFLFRKGKKTSES